MPFSSLLCSLMRSKRLLPPLLILLVIGASYAQSVASTEKTQVLLNDAADDTGLASRVQQYTKTLTNSASK